MRPSLGTAVVLVVFAIASVQLGAGFAKLLFEDAGPHGVLWLRLATSAVVLVVWTRPRLRGRSREDWYAVARFGVCLATMNWAIYQSFTRLPIGVAVTIEFIGPLLLAAIGFRRPRDLTWVVLAALGVLLLGFERGHFDPVGVAFALLAGAAWAGYIVSSAQTGRRWDGVDGLVVAAVIAAVIASPLLLTIDVGAMLDTRVLLIGAAVGLLSSVLPYSAEITALRTLPAATFGVLMSLEPAAAALAGLLVVGEELAPIQWLAIGCVVVASIGATRATRRPLHPDVTPGVTPDVTA